VKEIMRMVSLHWVQCCSATKKYRRKKSCIPVLFSISRQPFHCWWSQICQAFCVL